MVDEVLFDNWIQKEKRTSAIGKRKYLHFDYKIVLDKSKVDLKTFFSDIQKISQHSFYPFIKSEINSIRYKLTDKKDSKGKKVRELLNKPRPIAYSSHFDSLIYSWYSYIINHYYEAKIKTLGIEKCVTAYLETGYSNIDYSKEVFDFISGQEECTAMAFDITGFFDNLDHEILKRNWAALLGTEKLPSDHFKIYTSLTNYSVVNRSDLLTLFSNPKQKYCSPKEFREIVRSGNYVKINDFKNKITDSKRFGKQCGIPQGSPISACLSNVYMIEFDRSLNEWVTNHGGLYRRYSDDIIVVIENSLAKQARELIETQIMLQELILNPSKTEVTYFKRNKDRSLHGYDMANVLKSLQYLGFEFNGENVYIRSSSISKYYQRLNSRIRKALVAAYGKNSVGEKVFKKKIFNRYTDKGKRNFISYAQRAADTMGSVTIRNQYKRNSRIVKKKFDQKNDAYVAKHNILRKKE